jgi:4-hydroxy-4-methyl-2-oxoglutarate aldolase
MDKKQSKKEVPKKALSSANLAKTLTGRVPREAIRLMQITRLAPELLQQFAAIEDLTGAVSDAMDNLGLSGAVPASILSPTLPLKRLVAQALTVRNVERTEGPHQAALSGKGKMGEHEAYNLAEPGDVIVIEGLLGISNMGGQSATVAHRAGCAGVIIDGSFRDPGASRERGFPVWARGVTPITGKWRLETVEINGRVRIAGISVNAGDLVVADEAGVVFVPFAHAQAVLEQAQNIDQGDRRQRVDIHAGIDLASLAAKKYK